MIKLSNIYFFFQSNSSLFSGLSYSVGKNEIISIIGYSGCGKSTLLNLLSGLLAPNSGNIKINGDISYLTQNVTLLDYRTAFENSLLACELRNILTNEKIVKANMLFNLFKLGNEVKSKFPTELSGGMKQRIGLIQTLLVDSEIYLLDEPFNAIDRSTNLLIQNYIWNTFKTKLSTGLIVTHDLEQAVLMSDKVLILLNNSKIVELVFNKEFKNLSPNSRQGSSLSDQYLIEIIKTLNEN
jgi:ABC-type nitrate/sulfonate/bicarbonate transport system ATPase subunit